MRASRPTSTRLALACSASAMSEGTGTTGRAAPSARPCAMPQAMRSPVNEPGPCPNAKASMSPVDSRARDRSWRTIGARRSACWLGARASSVKSSSPRSRAAEQSSVEVSIARRFKGGGRGRMPPLYRCVALTVCLQLLAFKTTYKERFLKLFLDKGRGLRRAPGVPEHPGRKVRIRGGRPGRRTGRGPPGVPRRSGTRRHWCRSSRTPGTGAARSRSPRRKGARRRRRPTSSSLRRGCLAGGHARAACISASVMLPSAFASMVSKRAARRGRPAASSRLIMPSALVSAARRRSAKRRRAAVAGCGPVPLAGQSAGAGGGACRAAGPPGP